MWNLAVVHQKLNFLLSFSYTRCCALAHLLHYCSLTTDCAEAQQQAQQRGYLKRCKGTVFGSRILGLRLLNLIAKDILSLFEKTWVTSPIPKVR
ncbi:hypothetical protein NO976_03332 [Planktothrix agardhii]|nr:hypothetical protein NO976_03332 [Planktothrix agardhii]